jgi:hypothetical protein
VPTERTLRNCEADTQLTLSMRPSSRFRGRSSSGQNASLSKRVTIDAASKFHVLWWVVVHCAPASFECACSIQVKGEEERGGRGGREGRGGRSRVTSACTRRLGLQTTPCTHRQSWHLLIRSSGRLCHLLLRQVTEDEHFRKKTKAVEHMHREAAQHIIMADRSDDLGDQEKGIRSRCRLG